MEMRHSILDLQSVPLIKMKIDDELINPVVDFFYNTIKDNAIKNGDVIYNDEISRYCNLKTVFQDYSDNIHIQNLKNSLLEKSNHVYREIMNYDSDLRITEAWINECPIGGSLRVHNHANCLFSGTLYLVADEHTSITFKNGQEIPNNVHLLRDEPNISRPNIYGYSYHASEFNVYPKKGEVLFWPSFIKHLYKDNKTPNRLSLSFNLMPKKFNSMYDPFRNIE